MKAHLGNPNCHEDNERCGLDFGNKNKKINGKRKIRDQKSVSRRKKICIKDKLSFVKLVIDKFDFSIDKIEEINNAELAVMGVVKNLREKGILLKTNSLRRYVNQRANLQARYGTNRYRVLGCGAIPDSFLILRKSDIEKSLLILRRIPNVTLEIFFEFFSRKYPEWRSTDEDPGSERLKRFYRFRNFLTRNNSGLN